MPQDNSIPNKVWGGPSAVDSFISGRNAALDYKSKQAELDRNQVLAGRQDTLYDQGQQDRRVEQLGALAFSADTPQKWQQATAFAEDQLKVPGARSIPFERRAEMLAMSKQAQALAKDQRGEFVQDRAFGLQTQQLDETRRSNQANEALAGQRLSTVGGTLPQRVQTAEDDDISAIQTTQSINTQLDEVLNQLRSGDLELGPVNNFMGGVQNALGASTPNSRNLAAFQATLEKIRNDSLRLNKGVQTEGDAVRAWNEVTKSINDPNVVALQLSRIKKLNEMAARQRQQAINVRRSRNRAAPFDFNEISAQPLGGTAPPAGAGPQPGMVEDGFEFQGGDPSDPNNWAPVQ